MRYRLFIGNRLYFTWSLAAWLMFEKFGLSAQVDVTVFRPESENGVRALLGPLAPARTLPTVIAPDGALLSDSMAIAEELASRHPEKPFWPSDPRARGTARALAAEMHSSFAALRGNWPMNLRHAYEAQPEPPAVRAELRRLEEIWAHARRTVQAEGPWLCGAYSLADAIFAPMAARLAGYGFDTRPTTAAYVASHLADPAFQAWRAKGLAEEPVMEECERAFARRPWLA